MKFSEKLIRLRKIKGMTQDELASAVGVSRQAVYKWESGQSYPEAIKLIELKKLFEISIDDLLDESYEVALPEKKKRKRSVRKPVETVTDRITPSEAEEKISHASISIESSLEKKVESEPSIESSMEKEVEAIEPISVVKDEPISKAKEEEMEKEKEQKPTPEKKVGFFGRIFGRR